MYSTNSNLTEALQISASNSNQVLSLQETSSLTDEIQNAESDTPETQITNDNSTVILSPRAVAPNYTPPLYRFSNMTPLQLLRFLEKGVTTPFRLTAEDAELFLAARQNNELLHSFKTGQKFNLQVINTSSTTPRSTNSSLVDINDIQRRKENFKFWSRPTPLLRVENNTEKFPEVTEYIIGAPLKSVRSDSATLRIFNATSKFISQVSQVRTILRIIASPTPNENSHNNLIKHLDRGIFNNLIMYPHLSFSKAFKALNKVIHYIRAQPLPPMEALKSLIDKSLNKNNRIFQNLDINIVELESLDVDLPLELYDFSRSADFNDFTSGYRYLSTQIAKDTTTALLLLIDKQNFVPSIVNIVIRILERIENTGSRNVAQVGIDELLTVFNQSNSTISSENIFNHNIIKSQYSPVVNLPLEWLGRRSNYSLGPIRALSIASPRYRSGSLYKELEDVNNSSISVENKAILHSKMLEQHSNHQIDAQPKASSLVAHYQNEAWYQEGSKLLQQIKASDNSTLYTAMKSLPKNEASVTGNLLQNLTSNNNSSRISKELSEKREGDIVLISGVIILPTLCLIGWCWRQTLKNHNKSSNTDKLTLNNKKGILKGKNRSLKEDTRPSLEMKPLTSTKAQDIEQGCNI